MVRGRDRDARRDELSDAVQRAVVSRGLERVRLRDIADEIGVTPAAVLYHCDLNKLTYETYRRAIERFSQERERVAHLSGDARDQLGACIELGVASGPDDSLTRLLFEYWPRCLRDPRAAALDSALTERQITVYYGILTLGQAQGHFVLSDPLRMIAATLVAMEDGYQMEVLAGRRSRDDVLSALHSYARLATGFDPSDWPPARVTADAGNT